MSLLKKIYNKIPITLQNLAVTFEGMRIKIKEIRLLKLKKLLIFAKTYSRF